MTESNNDSFPKFSDIFRFRPDTWDQIIGNPKIKRFLQQACRELRKEYKENARITPGVIPSFLLSGDSRSGKTALVKHFVRCLTCKKVSEETLDPCDGSCKVCCEKIEKYGSEGIYSVLLSDFGCVPVEFIAIDCTKLSSPKELQDRLSRYYNGDPVLRIIYFDEAHRLVSRNMDEMLLKEIEEKDFVWIFSTAKPDDLEPMFLNRLIKFKTEFPNGNELANWLVDRCDELGVVWEENAIKRLVEKSNYVPGTALHCLALAALNRKEGLTLDLVENNWEV